MEIALEPAMPTYSGGLGVLAGDTIRSAADLKVPMVAMTLLHRKGYFNQKLDPNAGRRNRLPSGLWRSSAANSQAGLTPSSKAALFNCAPGNTW